MSVGFFWSTPTDSPETDESRGREILLSFHQASLYHPDYPYRTLEQMLSHYGNVGSVMPEGIGLTQRVLEMSVSEAQGLMQILAENAEGRMPQNWMAFNNALKDKAMNPSWFEIIKHVGEETVTDIVDIAQDVGDGAITTLRLTKNLLPILVWGGAAFGVFYMIRSFSAPIRKLDINKAVEDITRKE